MSKDPAFLFYPGDYLRDTQCLSEPVQVAYDRIMCEHMRNICITQKQLNFFTKRLTEDQRDELSMVITEKEGGYYIEWVVDSINKRRSYSESRRKNREGSKKNNSKSIKKDIISYDSHMENEIENEIISKSKIKNELLEYFEYLKKDHNRDIGHMQIEQTLKMLGNWYKNDEDKKKCLSANIANGWKTLNSIKIENNQPKQTKNLHPSVEEIRKEIEVNNLKEDQP